MDDAYKSPPLRWLVSDVVERRRRARQYWIKDTAMGVLNVSIHVGLRYVPIDFCSWLGAHMGALAQVRRADEARQGREVWRRLRPHESDPAHVEATLQRMWRHFGRTLAEFSVLDRMLRKGRVEIVGMEHARAARAAGKRIIFAANHLGNWEVIGTVLIANGYFGAGIYEVPENRFEHWVVRNFRKRYGAKLVPQGTAGARAAVRTLTESEVMLIFLDDVIAGKVNSPAFGRPLPTEGNITLVPRLAALADAEVIPIYCLRLNDRAQFRVTFLPPMPYVRTRDRKADLATNVAMTNALLEQQIQPNLDQWYYINWLDVGSEPQKSRT